LLVSIGPQLTAMPRGPRRGRSTRIIADTGPSRPAHAKGILLTGTFTPSSEAASLPRAPHLHRNSRPVTVRFSDFAGIPTVVHNDPRGASPRGFAVRFHLGEHVHTDIIGHSVDNFPMRTAEGLVEFLNAVIATDPAGPHPNAIEQFLGAHPAAQRFVQIPKPIPTSFARESFFAVSAFNFTNADGISRYGRYRVLSVPGNEFLDATEAAARSPNFLFDEIRERVPRGPVSVVVQLAEDGDTIGDATVRWPEERPQRAFGEIRLRQIVANNAGEQQSIIFDPIPRGMASRPRPILSSSREPISI
jgi:catalase